LELFPSNLTIEECREATKGFPGFRVQEKADYLTFNYDFAFRESFPDPKKCNNAKEARLLSIRRECRGLIFNKETGVILSRRFHKFFNIHELDETMPELIRVDRPHVLLEKIDGSLVAPFITEGKLRFGSKMGVTDVTFHMEEHFFTKTKIPYVEFCEKWVKEGYTPMFEWTSPSHQIILEYNQEQLTLIAIRRNSNGIYLPFKDVVARATEVGIPVVKPLESPVYGKDYHSMDELVKCIKVMDKIEGCVIMFEGGEMYKMKSEWYIERSKRQSADFSTHEKDLWTLVLDNGVDDIAFAIGERRRKIIDDFGASLITVLRSNADQIQKTVSAAKSQGMSKGEFVTHVQKLLKKGDCKDTLLQNHFGIYYKVFDGHDAYDTVRSTVKQHCATLPKLELIRNTLCGGLKISL